MSAYLFSAQLLGISTGAFYGGKRIIASNIISFASGQLKSYKSSPNLWLPQQDGEDLYYVLLLS